MDTKYTRKDVYQMFYRWGINRNTKSWSDYERGKTTIQGMALDPDAYFLIITWLADYLGV